METAITERLKALINNKSSSILDFSKQIGIAQTTLSSQLCSTRGISINVISLTLIAFPDVSAEWLLRGKGNMLLSESSEDFDNTISEEYPVSAETFNKLANTFAGLAKQFEDVMEDYIKVKKELDEYHKKDDIKHVKSA